MGKLLSQVYQVFQVEVGLHGNIFDYSFENYGDLATHGFFRNMWQLLQLVGAQFRKCNTFDILLLWQEDRAAMEAIVDTGIFSQRELVRMNRFCHHKKMHSIGDMTQCNGITVHPTMFLQEEGESYRAFPAQCPTTPDHGLWLCAIGSLTVSGHQLQHPLGVYTADPHHPDVWFTIKNHSKIYWQLLTQEDEMYQWEMMGWQTRYGTGYLLMGTQEGECSRLVRVSIRDWSGQALCLHSSTITAQGHTEPLAPTRLCEVLQSWGNQSLWVSLHIDGDEEWIFIGLIRGLLIIGHDGSYMRHLPNNVCSYAVVIHCQNTGCFVGMTILTLLKRIESVCKG
jgi:hypothetical protein